MDGCFKFCYSLRLLRFCRFKWAVLKLRMCFLIHCKSYIKVRYGERCRAFNEWLGKYECCVVRVRENVIRQYAYT